MILTDEVGRFIESEDFLFKIINFKLNTIIVILIVILLLILFSGLIYYVRENF